MSGNIKFTSDTHFGHEAMATRGWRPFATIEEHDEFLIERWNADVRPKDTVWHLGDAVHDGRRIVELMNRLNGTKHLITGNHDEVWPRHRNAHNHQRRWLEAFETVQTFARRRVGKQYYLLSHFPWRGGGDHTEEERHSEYRFNPADFPGYWLVHGHTHSPEKVSGNQIHVGVDAWGWGPTDLDMVVAISRGEVTLS